MRSRYLGGGWLCLALWVVLAYLHGADTRNVGFSTPGAIAEYSAGYTYRYQYRAHYTALYDGRTQDVGHTDAKIALHCRCRSQDNQGWLLDLAVSQIKATNQVIDLVDGNGDKRKGRSTRYTTSAVLRDDGTFFLLFNDDIKELPTSVEKLVSAVAQSLNVTIPASKLHEVGCHGEQLQSRHSTPAPRIHFRVREFDTTQRTCDAECTLTMPVPHGLELKKVCSVAPSRSQPSVQRPAYTPHPDVDPPPFEEDGAEDMERNTRSTVRLACSRIIHSVRSTDLTQLQVPTIDGPNGASTTTPKIVVRGKMSLKLTTVTTGSRNFRRCPHSRLRLPNHTHAALGQPVTSDSLLMESSRVETTSMSEVGTNAQLSFKGFSKFCSVVVERVLTFIANGGNLVTVWENLLLVSKKLMKVAERGLGKTSFAISDEDIEVISEIVVDFTSIFDIGFDSPDFSKMRFVSVLLEVFTKGAETVTEVVEARESLMKDIPRFDTGKQNLLQTSASSDIGADKDETTLKDDDRGDDVDIDGEVTESEEDGFVNDKQFADLKAVSKVIKAIYPQIRGPLIDLFGGLQVEVEKSFEILGGTATRFERIRELIPEMPRKESDDKPAEVKKRDVRVAEVVTIIKQTESFVDTLIEEVRALRGDAEEFVKHMKGVAREGANVVKKWFPAVKLMAAGLNIELVGMSYGKSFGDPDMIQVGLSTRFSVNFNGGGAEGEGPAGSGDGHDTKTSETEPTEGHGSSPRFGKDTEVNLGETMPLELLQDSEALVDHMRKHTRALLSGGRMRSHKGGSELRRSQREQRDFENAEPPCTTQESEPADAHAQSHPRGTVDPPVLVQESEVATERAQTLAEGLKDAHASPELEVGLDISTFSRSRNIMQLAFKPKVFMHKIENTTPMMTLLGYNIPLSREKDQLLKHFSKAILANIQVTLLDPEVIMPMVVRTVRPALISNMQDGFFSWIRKPVGETEPDEHEDSAEDVKPTGFTVDDADLEESSTTGSTPDSTSSDEGSASKKEESVVDSTLQGGKVGSKEDEPAPPKAAKPNPNVDVSDRTLLGVILTTQFVTSGLRQGFNVVSCLDETGGVWSKIAYAVTIADEIVKFGAGFVDHLTNADAAMPNFQKASEAVKKYSDEADDGQRALLVLLDTTHAHFHDDLRAQHPRHRVRLLQRVLKAQGELGKILREEGSVRGRAGPKLPARLVGVTLLQAWEQSNGTRNHSDADAAATSYEEKLMDFDVEGATGNVLKKFRTLLFRRLGIAMKLLMTLALNAGIEEMLKERLEPYMDMVKGPVIIIRGVVSAVRGLMDQLTTMFRLLEGILSGVADPAFLITMFASGKIFSDVSGGLSGIASALTYVQEAMGTPPMLATVMKALPEFASTLNSYVPLVDKAAEISKCTIGFGMEMIATAKGKFATAKTVKDKALALKDVSTATTNHYCVAKYKEQVPITDESMKLVVKRSIALVPVLCDAVAESLTLVQDVNALVNGLKTAPNAVKYTSDNWKPVFFSANSLLGKMLLTCEEMGVTSGRIVTVLRFMQKAVKILDYIVVKLIGMIVEAQAKNAELPDVEHALAEEESLQMPSYDEATEVTPAGEESVLVEPHATALHCLHDVIPHGVTVRPLFVKSSFPVLIVSVGPIFVFGIPVTIKISVEAQFFVELQSGSCRAPPALGAPEYKAYAGVLGFSLMSQAKVGFGPPSLSLGVKLDLQIVEINLPLQADVDLSTKSACISSFPTLRAGSGTTSLFVRVGGVELESPLFKWEGVHKVFPGPCWASHPDRFDVCPKAVPTLGQGFKLPPPATQRASLGHTCHLCSLSKTGCTAWNCVMTRPRYSALAGGPDFVRLLDNWLDQASITTSCTADLVAADVFGGLMTTKDDIEVMSVCAEEFRPAKDQKTGAGHAIFEYQAVVALRWVQLDSETSWFSVSCREKPNSGTQGVHAEYIWSTRHLGGYKASDWILEPTLSDEDKGFARLIYGSNWSEEKLSDPMEETGKMGQNFKSKVARFYEVWRSPDDTDRASRRDSRVITVPQSQLRVDEKVKSTQVVMSDCINHDHDDSKMEYSDTCKLEQDGQGTVRTGQCLQCNRNEVSNRVVCPLMGSRRPDVIARSLSLPTDSVPMKSIATAQTWAFEYCVDSNSGTVDDDRLWTDDNGKFVSLFVCDEGWKMDGKNVVEYTGMFVVHKLVPQYYRFKLPRAEAVSTLELNEDSKSEVPTTFDGRHHPRAETPKYVEQLLEVQEQAGVNSQEKILPFLAVGLVAKLASRAVGGAVDAFNRASDDRMNLDQRGWGPCSLEDVTDKMGKLPQMRERAVEDLAQSYAAERDRKYIENGAACVEVPTLGNRRIRGNMKLESFEGLPNAAKPPGGSERRSDQCIWCAEADDGAVVDCHSGAEGEQTQRALYSFGFLGEEEERLRIARMKTVHSALNAIIEDSMGPADVGGMWALCDEHVWTDAEDAGVSLGGVMCNRYGMERRCFQFVAPYQAMLASDMTDPKADMKANPGVKTRHVAPSETGYNYFFDLAVAERVYGKPPDTGDMVWSMIGMGSGLEMLPRCPQAPDGTIE